MRKLSVILQSVIWASLACSAVTTVPKPTVMTASSFASTRYVADGSFNFAIMSAAIHSDAGAPYLDIEFAIWTYLQFDRIFVAEVPVTVTLGLSECNVFVDAESGIASCRFPYTGPGTLTFVAQPSLNPFYSNQAITTATVRIPAYLATNIVTTAHDSFSVLVHMTVPKYPITDLSAPPPPVLVSLNAPALGATTWSAPLRTFHDAVIAVDSAPFRSVSGAVLVQLSLTDQSSGQVLTIDTSLLVYADAAYVSGHSLARASCHNQTSSDVYLSATLRAASTQQPLVGHTVIFRAVSDPSSAFTATTDQFGMAVGHLPLAAVANGVQAVYEGNDFSYAPTTLSFSVPAAASDIRCPVNTSVALPNPWIMKGELTVQILPATEQLPIIVHLAGIQAVGVTDLTGHTTVTVTGVAAGTYFADVEYPASTVYALSSGMLTSRFLVTVYAEVLLMTDFLPTTAVCDTATDVPMSITLRRQSDNTPVAGQRVTFQSAIAIPFPQCSAVTDQDGLAVCALPASFAIAVRVVMGEVSTAIGTCFAKRLRWDTQHKYQLCIGDYTWAQARAAARVAGGYLATITSTQEQQSVQQMVSHSLASTEQKRALWLGGFVSDNVSDVTYSVFRWADGPEAGQEISQLTTQGAAVECLSVYCNWRSAHPNVTTASEQQQRFMVSLTKAEEEKDAAAGMWDAWSRDEMATGFLIEFEPDLDDDGIADSVDNCPQVYNPEQQQQQQSDPDLNNNHNHTSNHNNSGDACNPICADCAIGYVHRDHTFSIALSPSGTCLSAGLQPYHVSLDAAAGTGDDNDNNDDTVDIVVRLRPASGATASPIGAVRVWVNGRWYPTSESVSGADLLVVASVNKTAILSGKQAIVIEHPLTPSSPNLVRTSAVYEYFSQRLSLLSYEPKHSSMCGHGQFNVSATVGLHTDNNTPIQGVQIAFRKCGSTSHEQRCLARTDANGMASCTFTAQQLGAAMCIATSNENFDYLLSPVTVPVTYNDALCPPNS